MKKNKLSVVIPFYNGDAFVFETIKSLYEQTRKVDEIIIVNDGSTSKKSIEILNKINKDYDNIKILNQKNKGISGAMTAGAKRAKGNIIFGVDCDDVLNEQYIYEYMQIFENNENISAVTCGYGSFLNGKNYTKKNNINYAYIPEGLILPKLFFQNCAGGANAAFRKKDLKEIDFWSERYSSFQDYGIWLKFVEHNLKLYVIPEILYYYRLHNESDMFTSGVKFDLKHNIFLSIQKIREKRPDIFNENLFLRTYSFFEKINNKNNKNDFKIKFMKSSIFWKLIEQYFVWKEKIRFVIFSPKKFLKKYYIIKRN